jgi:hypothetical protein
MRRATHCQAATRSPNFVFILSDDQGWPVTSVQMHPTRQDARSDYFQTPNLERLASQAMRFSQGYAPAALCSPTRRSIQFGQMPVRQGSRSFGAKYPTNNTRPTIPRILKSVNPRYRAAHFGKWDHRTDLEPKYLGYDESDGNTTNREGSITSGFDNREKWHRYTVTEDPKRIFSLTDRSIDFMMRNVAAGRPFYLQISHYAVHVAMQTRLASLEKYEQLPKGEKHNVPAFAGMTEDLEAGLGFAGSMLAGYTAVLASPEFVYLEKKPGLLDDYALATRLALFLWNSEPDVALRARAARGELRRPEVLKAETDRMLGDPKAHRFVDAFLDYWLEIRRMEDTTPSTTLYNDYYLDDSLTEAALDETRLYFTELLQRDLPARNIVDSDFTYLNDRLAVHYGILGVEGVAMRRVALPADSVRGGVMTQASVLKVTANGTTTSPVLRGKWIMERIVGFDMPPPPAAVPAVEPDIRGAVTIRDQLDKHRADESCAICHRKIDPPGFALESFDVMGAWRDHYRANAQNKEPEKGFGKNGWPFAFNLALPVDATGDLADGRAFRDVRDFKQLLLKDDRQIARNLARQLTVYATGAPVRFSDREKIEQILQRTSAREYGVRSIVSEIIQSELFLSK